MKDDGSNALDVLEKAYQSLVNLGLPDSNEITMALKAKIAETKQLVDLLGKFLLGFPQTFFPNLLQFQPHRVPTYDNQPQQQPQPHPPHLSYHCLHLHLHCEEILWWTNCHHPNYHKYNNHTLHPHHNSHNCHNNNSLVYNHHHHHNNINNKRKRACCSVPVWWTSTQQAAPPC